jgi:hypothetical protein
MNPIKTTVRMSIEECEIGPDNTLALIGCDKLCDKYKKYNGFNPNFTCDCNDFGSTFSNGDTLLYLLKHVREGSAIYQESGIATFLGDSLKRSKILFAIQGESVPLFSPRFYTPQNITDSDFFEVSSRPLLSFNELFIQPHSISYSNSDCCPSLLSVDEDSLIGRTNGEIASIPISHISSQDQTISHISTFTKSILMKAYKLYVRILNCSIIVFSPHSSKSKAVQGSLVWDSNTNQLKFHDKVGWRVLKLGDYDEEKT